MLTVKSSIKRILLFSLSVSISACAPKNKSKITLPKKQDTIQNICTSKPDTIKEEKEIVQEKTDEFDNCIRGQAKPIIKRSHFPNTKFVLQSDSITGIETVNFDNGDKLILTNGGCEYFTLSFRFETSRFQHDTKDFEFWCYRAIELMYNIVKGIDAPIDVRKGIDELQNKCEISFHMDYESFELGDQLDYGGDDIRSFMAVTKIEKLNAEKYAVELYFSMGPL